MARGQLAVASEHLHFRGPGLSFRLAYDSVVNWEPYHDGIGAAPRAQPNRLVVFRNGDGWFIYNLEVWPESHWPQRHADVLQSYTAVSRHR